MLIDINGMDTSQYIAIQYNTNCNIITFMKVGVYCRTALVLSIGVPNNFGNSVYKVWSGWLFQIFHWL